MRAVIADQVRQFLLERYAQALSSTGVSSQSLPDDYDLLERGIIDSIGILEMIGAVEAKFEIELDLENLDAELLTKIGPVCPYVEASAARSGNESALDRNDKAASARPILRSTQQPYAGEYHS
jgi:acyl carrier protein